MPGKRIFDGYKGSGDNVPRNITHVRFHPSVVYMSGEALAWRPELREVELNNGLKEIEDFAFYKCISLHSINVPSTVTKIGDGAFEKCSSLRKIVLNDDLRLREIGVAAFRNCTYLQSINIQSTVAQIGGSAFRDCRSLKEVVLNEGLQKIGYRTFMIGTAFEDCSNLRHVLFNNGLQKIRQGAFARCISLQSIELPSTLSEVEEYTFIGCRQLTKAVVKEGIKKIGQLVETITLPSTITEIGNQAFSSCRSLRKVELKGIPKVNQVSFVGCSSLDRFTFPSLSIRLEAIIQAGQIEAENKIDQIPHLGRTGTEIHLLVSSRYSQNGAHWIYLKPSLDQIIKLITYYEIKEATALFELALWKAKLDQAEEASDVNRDSYRIEVPGPVKDSILQYLL